MTWVKLDDGFPEHPKVLGLSDREFRVYMRALCWAARNQTNGELETGVARTFCTPKVSKKFVGLGLWDEMANGFKIHNYLKYNFEKQDTNLRRAKLTAARSEAGKKGARSRWQTENPMANDMANPMANGWQVDGPVPLTRAINKKNTAADPKLSDHNPAPPPGRPRQRSNDFQAAMKIPIQERAQMLLDNPHKSEWIEPHKWPEILEFAENMSKAVGWTFRPFRAPTRTVTALVLLHATFTVQELKDATRAAQGSPKWFQGKGLGSLSDEVIRRALSNQTPHVPDKKPLTPEQITEERLFQKQLKEMGISR